MTKKPNCHNPGIIARATRRIDKAVAREMHRAMAEWTRSKKGSRGYYAMRHRRRSRKS